MARITGRLRIAAPIETVFDMVADSRNEPSFNPSMTAVELLTTPPVRRGTQFLAYMGKSRMKMLVEITEYDRPFRLGSRTTSPVMVTSGALTFGVGLDGATIMSWDWLVQPSGWLRLVGPLVGPVGARMERKIWNAAKRQLEAEGNRHP